MRPGVLLPFLASLLMLAPAAAGDPPAQAQGGDRVTERGFDEAGRLAWEEGLRTDDDSIAFLRVYHHQPAQARGGGGGGGSPDPTNDCQAKQYAAAGWTWRAPYSAVADQHASLFDQALSTWDAKTGAALSGGVSPGKAGEAGTFDGVNQIEFESLGATSTIAVTTTWYNRFTGEAVESDGQYNTAYSWATDGSAGAMDVLNIAVHEVGHTYGLDHPRGKGIGCLSMYAYASAGETAKRTLGVGDVLGIQALYGA